MYLHSWGNHKIHLGVICWDQCLQHVVQNGVPTTPKFLNIRPFNKLIKTNTCITKIICIKKMTHVEILPQCWLFGPHIQPHRVQYHPPWEASIFCKSKNCIYYEYFNMCTIWKILKLNNNRVLIMPLPDHHSS